MPLDRRVTLPVFHVGRMSQAKVSFTPCRIRSWQKSIVPISPSRRKKLPKLQQLVLLLVRLALPASQVLLELLCPPQQQRLAHWLKVPRLQHPTLRPLLRKRQEQLQLAHLALCLLSASRSSSVHRHLLPLLLPQTSPRLHPVRSNHCSRRLRSSITTASSTSVLKCLAISTLVSWHRSKGWEHSKRCRCCRPIW